MNQHVREQLIFLGLVIVVFAWATWEATGFTGQARTYPLVVGGAALVIGLLEFVIYAFTAGRAKDQPTGESLVQRFRKALPFLSWLGGLYVLIYLIGMVVSSGIFTCLFLIVIQDVMSLKWPKSIIDPLDWVGLG